jgi:polygalacturonase
LLWLQRQLALCLGSSPGATILAADSPLPGEATGYNGGTYDSAEPNAWDAYQDYGHNHWHNSLIWGGGLENCSIVGPGLIWGKGLSNGRTAPHGRLGYRFVAKQPGVGNKSIALKNCRNVVLRDFVTDLEMRPGYTGRIKCGTESNGGFRDITILPTSGWRSAVQRQMWRSKR